MRGSAMGRARIGRTHCHTACCLALCLGGCAWFGSDEPAPPCPRAVILEEAAATSAYLPGRSEPAAVRHVAALRDLASGCRYNEGGLEVDLAVDILADQGPAGSGQPVEVTWFVATVGPDGGIRSKQTFTAAVPFAPGQDVAGVAEGLTLRYPGIGAAEGPGLTLYLGFQVDEHPAEAPRGPALIR